MTCGLYEATGSAPSTPQRINLNSGPKTVSGGSTAMLNATTQKRSTKSDIIPVIVPRTSTRSEPVADSRKEVGDAGTTMPFSLQSKAVDIRKFPNSRDDVDKPPLSPVTESAASKCSELSGFADKNNFPASVSSIQGIPIPKKGFKLSWSWQAFNKLTDLSVNNQLEVLYKPFIHNYAYFPLIAICFIVITYLILLLV